MRDNTVRKHAVVPAENVRPFAVSARRALGHIQSHLTVAAALVCAAAAIGFAAPRVSAQNEAPAPSGKIAVFNRKMVFDNFKTREVEEKALQDERNARQAELDKMRNAINEERKKLRDDKTLTDEQRQALVDKSAAEERDYEDKFRRIQGEINDKGDKFYSHIGELIDTGVRELGQKENYTIILDSDPKASTLVLYFDPSLDITDKITAQLNSSNSAAPAPEKR